MMFTLNSPLSSSSFVNEDDVMNTKQFLSDLGLYPNDRDIHGFTDNELFDGIRGFQSQNNLNVDGVIRPVGETIDAINDLLGNFFGGSSRRGGRAPTRRFSVHAPAFSWGEWVEVFSQFGVTGRNPQNHKTKIMVSLETNTIAPSSFDYEIRGGDHFIRGVSGKSTSEIVMITGNIATEISVRAKSHSSIQTVIVTVR